MCEIFAGWRKQRDEEVAVSVKPTPFCGIDDSLSLIDDDGMLCGSR